MEAKAYRLSVPALHWFAIFDLTGIPFLFKNITRKFEIWLKHVDGFLLSELVFYDECS